MTERYDYGGTGWGVGPELSNERLMMDGREAQESFIIIAQNIHGDKFDYSKTEFRTMKTPVIVIKDGVEHTVIPAIHLMDKQHGGVYA